jgi:hypothetical protein
MRTSFGTDDLRQALDRVREWTRARFALPDDALILVVEAVPKLPGFPPRETVIWFWSDVRTRHHFKIFKPAADVSKDELPPPWMKTALIVPEGTTCSCC